MAGVARLLFRQAWLVAVFLILLPWLDGLPVLLSGMAAALFAIGAVHAGER